jgi:hypothetical protein
MIDLLKPQETVAKALRRLGKGKGKPLTTAQRWKAKRQKTAAGGEGGEGAVEEEDEGKKTMLRLTELSDLLVQEGMMEIYETSRERLGVMLKQVREKAGSKFAIPDDVDDDDALDMFADNFDKQAGGKESSSADVRNGDGGDAGGSQQAKEAPSASSGVYSQTCL